MSGWVSSDLRQQNIHTLDRAQSDRGDPPGAPAPTESPATWPCALRADALDEFLWRRPAPLGAERLVRRQQMRAAPGVQAIGVGPALVHPAPGIRPVVVDLAAEQVPADPPHVLVLAEFLQALVTGEHVVDVVDLEREVVQPSLLVLEAEEHVMIDVLVATVTAVERTDEVVLALHVHVVRANEAQCIAEPLHSLLELRRPHDTVPDALDRCRLLRQTHQFTGPPQGFRARVHRLTAHRDRG